MDTELERAFRQAEVARDNAMAGEVQAINTKDHPRAARKMQEATERLNALGDQLYEARRADTDPAILIERALGYLRVGKISNARGMWSKVEQAMQLLEQAKARLNN